MVNSINIIWWWTIWCRIAILLTNNNVDVTIVTRNKEKTFLLLWNKQLKIKVKNYNEKVIKNIPCLIIVSSNESDIINSLIKKWGKKIDRFCVKEDNLKVIKSLINYLENINSNTYFVLTNPVEYIMLELLNNSEIDSKKIFWLWLDLDSKRFQIAIKMMTWYEFKNEIKSVWYHIFPFPLIEIDIFDNKYSLNYILNKLIENSNYIYSNWWIDIYKEFINVINLEYKYLLSNKFLSFEDLYNLIQKFTQILIKSEFFEWKPPVDFPVFSIIETILNYFKWNYINVSYIKNLEIKWGELMIKNNSIIEKNLKLHDYYKIKINNIWFTML